MILSYINIYLWYTKSILIGSVDRNSFWGFLAKKARAKKNIEFKTIIKNTKCLMKMELLNMNILSNQLKQQDIQEL